ncbi:MAG: hypothetical protein IJ685_10500 [Selenomonadaceae bacterium]|nr:hypothetical protein [Selenomonadaceae bacterium]
MSTTIYNTGKVSNENIFGNVARRTVTKNSYAEILSQTVEKNPADMTPAEYKNYFAQRLSEIPFDDTRSDDVEMIRISDAAWKKLQSDSDYAEKILSDIAHERATPNKLQGLYSNGEMKVRYIEAAEENCRVVSTEDVQVANLRFDVDNYIYNGNKSLIRRLRNARQDILTQELFRQVGTLQNLKLQRFLNN